MREARPVQTGSAAYPQPTRGVPHNGVDMMIGGSSRHQVLTQGFDRISPRPASIAAAPAADIDG